MNDAADNDRRKLRIPKHDFRIFIFNIGQLSVPVRCEVIVTCVQYNCCIAYSMGTRYHYYSCSTMAFAFATCELF